MAVVGEERMRSAMTALDDSNQALHMALSSSVIMFKMVAEDLEAENQTEQVEELGQATKDIISLMDELDYYNKAFQFLKEQYHFTDESTDFEKLISEGIDLLKAQSPPLPPDQHHLYQQFKEAVWKVHHAGELMPGQEKEDLVITDSQYNVTNTHCPISGKAVELLDDPVRSLNCSHIYDRVSVIDYLRVMKNRKECPCAIAGCPKPLVESQLVCDVKLKVELQELRMRGRDRGIGHVHDVADCTEADEYEALDD